MNLIDIAFVDLDGTIIETKSGKTFPTDKHDWKLKPKVVSKIKSLIDKHDYKIVLVTNQAGISRGHVKSDEFLEKLESIKSHLPWEFLDHFIATSMNSVLRKPKVAGILAELSKKGIKPSHFSVMIGDAGGRPKDFSDSDLKFAENLGIEFIHVDDIK